MSEIDAMRLLAEANPVRVEALAPMRFPDLRHRRPQRRWVLAVAGAAVALAASLIGFFAFDGSPRRPQVGLRIVPPPTLAHPLVGAEEVSLADATKAFGAPIVLPDTALVGPSDAGAVWLQSHVPGIHAVAIAFPGPQIIVWYLPNELTGAPLAEYTAIAKGLSGAHVVDLGGVPGLAIAQNSDSTGANFGSLGFVIGGTEIVVLGHYDDATLRSIAQSIVDQARHQPPIVAGPATAPTNVDSAAAAQKLLPFAAVFPSEAAPTSLAVFEPSHQLMAFFNTSATGPYELVEGPSDETVAMLEETARRWTVGPIHEIDLVDGVVVLLQGWSDGSLTASWLRSDSGSTILTWIQGPETAARGQVDGTFTKQQALAIASDVIAQGG